MSHIVGLVCRDVNIPTTQSFLLYLALAMCFVPRVWAKRRRQGKGKGLMVAWWKYLLVAIADVEGNFLLVLAFQYTTITRYGGIMRCGAIHYDDQQLTSPTLHPTNPLISPPSVTLLDCFTIPCVMILSKLLFQVKYRSKHAAGATICLAGLGLLVASDVIRNRNGRDGAQASNQVYGDLLVLAGSAFYATSNVAQEKLVKNYDREEFLAMLGVFGSLVGGGQAALLEYDKLCAVTWDSVTVLLVLGFVTCMFLLYAGTPALLVRSSAVFLNLSLLTADFWSVVVAVELFGASLHWLYFVAFGLIVAGLFIWYTAENGLKDLEPRKAASYQIIETS